MFTRIYIHIPFCRRKCPYCAFFSREAGTADLAGYVDLLLREMTLAAEAAPARQEIDSIYFGGGTPSLLEPHQVGQLIARAGRLFPPAAGAEITLEANPGTLDDRKLAGYRTAGVNRLSLGVQSFSDSMLRALGRIHTAAQARAAYESARRAGFGNIGIDLIHALPGQTPELWQADLRQALRLAPDHLSVYGLTVEEDTPFAAAYPDDSPLLPDDGLAADMFDAAHDLLTGHGYEHYEIANYARPGCRSRHNSGYWRRDGCLGLGAGAHSFLKDSPYGSRGSNRPDLAAYAGALDTGNLPRQETLPLTREDAIAEYLFLGLRLADGVTFREFAAQFGSSLDELFAGELADLTAKGLLLRDAAGIRLSRRGMLLSNQVFHRFLP